MNSWLTYRRIQISLAVHSNITASFYSFNTQESKPHDCSSSLAKKNNRVQLENITVFYKHLVRILWQEVDLWFRAWKHKGQSYLVCWERLLAVLQWRTSSGIIKHKYALNAKLWHEIHYEFPVPMHRNYWKDVSRVLLIIKKNLPIDYFQILL